MKIRITRGIYGFKQNGNVLEKTASSTPFEVGDEEGKRLVALDVAEKVDDTDAEKDDSQEEGEESDAEDDVDDVLNKMAKISKESLADMSKEKLCVFAEALGVKKTRSKADLVEKLQKCPVWAEDAEVRDEEDDPNLFAEDPE